MLGVNPLFIIPSGFRSFAQKPAKTVEEYVEQNKKLSQAVSKAAPGELSQKIAKHPPHETTEFKRPDDAEAQGQNLNLKYEREPNTLKPPGSPGAEEEK